MKCTLLVLLYTLLLTTGEAIAQKRAKKAANTIYIDKQGLLRYSANKQEAAFFGVLYGDRKSVV